MKNLFKIIVIFITLGSTHASDGSDSERESVVSSQSDGVSDDAFPAFPDLGELLAPIGCRQIADGTWVNARGEPARKPGSVASFDGLDAMSEPSAAACSDSSAATTGTEGLSSAPTAFAGVGIIDQGEDEEMMAACVSHPGVQAWAGYRLQRTLRPHAIQPRAAAAACAGGSIAAAARPRLAPVDHAASARITQMLQAFPGREEGVVDLCAGGIGGGFDDSPKRTRAQHDSPEPVPAAACAEGSDDAGVANQSPKRFRDGEGSPPLVTQWRDEGGNVQYDFCSPVRPATPRRRVNPFATVTSDDSGEETLERDAPAVAAAAAAAGDSDGESVDADDNVSLDDEQDPWPIEELTSSGVVEPEPPRITQGVILAYSAQDIAALPNATLNKILREADEVLLPILEYMAALHSDAAKRDAVIRIRTRLLARVAEV